MKYPKATLMFLVLILPFKGLNASCHEYCYSAKQNCNKSKGHTFNSCEKDLFACKRSCNSGNNQETYRTDSLPFQLAPYLL